VTALLERPAPPVAAPSAGFLARYARTLGLLLAGTVALVLVGALLAPTTWLPALAVAAPWAGGVAVWLRRTGRAGRGAAHLCAWAGPVAVLAPLAAPGWLTPGGLLLWWPLSTFVAVAVATAERG